MIGNVYVFGGYVLTGGTFDGRAWQGVNVMLAEVKQNRSGGYDLPVLARVFKGSRTNSGLMDVVQSLLPGQYVIPYFSAPDAQGRSKLISIEVMDNG